MATIRKRGASWHVKVRRTGQPSITRSFRLKGDADAWARQMAARLDQNPLLLRRFAVHRNGLWRRWYRKRLNWWGNTIDSPDRYPR